MGYQFIRDKWGWGAGTLGAWCLYFLALRIPKMPATARVALDGKEGKLKGLVGGFSDLCPELRTRRGSWCWEGDLKPQDR